MATIEGSMLDFRQLDLLAAQDTVIHRLDARAKVLVVLLFIITVVSFGRYELSAMVPFFIFPVVMVVLADLPAGFIVRKVALVIPFAAAIGIFNPLFDQEIRLSIGSFGISGGWLSCASIVVRATLTVTAALMLVAVTGFTAVCGALERLGMPQALVVQLLFMQRYLFVLADDAANASRARELRAFGNRGMGIGPFAAMTGHLLLKSWERAERIHMAMLARGFQGEFYLQRTGAFGLRELLFVAGWLAVFMILRFTNIPLLIGEAVTRLFIAQATIP
ncbi:cobalt/nickel transport system permease protein [Trichlorobacter thiogenes]|uniref:Cobalt/nickel transport system permease protein n=1 Tax=Trichlorobacter thiogenes TaxID=115783 RepID=A0A1T4MTW2_9BACT|nr:cobalt ECF transporter T component CbiQ [Trichlorobacter thiogenes]SJZ70413.1 cobalt/nickel transport system permease protein [Trichlorobacter thiogenes]